MSKERENVEGSSSLSSCLKRPVEPGRGRRTMLALQGPGNTSTPCAACKLLRRRCAQECPFYPYFPATEPQRFSCVHKVFGASNVSKMLMEVPENQRADVANSLVYEANARLRDPVYGCMGIVSALQQRAQTLQVELNAVRAEIMRYMPRDNAAPAAILHSREFPSTAHERTPSAGTSSQTSGSSEYTVVSPRSSRTLPAIKEPFWSNLH